MPKINTYNLKRIAFIPVLLLSCLLSAQALKGRIKIDAERSNGEIDSLLYGNFTEHLGRCIYGGIYDPASTQADAYGFRKDVLQVSKDLKVSILRWPGGNFVSGYNWMDGIGPVAARPRKKELAWNTIETNKVGTDEFLQYAQRMGAQPYIPVNLGTGSLDDARNWVEYCNGDTGTYYANLRAKNGHIAPYKVKYWGLGNEMDGSWQMGAKSADDYGKYALEAAKLMKWVDPEIKLTVCGLSFWSSGTADWNRTVLNYLKGYADYISLHYYFGDRTNNYLDYMASMQDPEKEIKQTEAIINEVRFKNRIDKPIYIAFDEYNVWYRTGVEEKLEEKYNLQDALAIACFLNTLVRNAGTVKMANIAQLVNVISPLMITNDKLWKQTTYYPLQLFATNCYGSSLSLLVQSDTFNTERRRGVAYLDASSAYNKTTRTIVLNVVNRHPTRAIETSIENQF
ncbi:MAG TPA: alpha-L-arabinofuranosidase C-terminal domain-containing protein, partial [Chitinophagaceae bacterium]|nr:alpha-L-arabinofuranosidase C-terminal domain-containing protein [Chitinophagaceae bacterium]